MHDLSFMAASEWARTNASTGTDPAEFGRKVALVYLACRDADPHAGDKQACIDSISKQTEALYQAAQEARIIDAVLSSAGFSPNASTTPLPNFPKRHK